MHLPRIWLFWTVTLWRTLPHPAFWGDSLLWLLHPGGNQHPLLLPGLFRRSCPLLISALWDLFGPVFIRGARTTEAFQKKVYLGEKTLTELSYFHVLYFWSQSFSFFSYSVKRNPSGHPRGHHVRWNRKLNTTAESHWASCIKSFVSKFRYYSGTMFFSHFHSLFSLKWHERQLKYFKYIWTVVVCLVKLL